MGRAVQANSPTISAPPAATTAPSGSPSQTSTADNPTGSDILAHRGGDEKYPLQTFESLTAAADDGFAVETDVRWTSDNRAVIVHDEGGVTQGLRCDRPYRVGVPDDMESAQRELPLVYEEWDDLSACDLRKSDGGPRELGLMGLRRGQG